MKPISIFIVFVCLIYANCQIDCGESNCISDGLICQNKGDNTCNLECKPKYGTNQCYHCSGITNSRYYKITESNTCELDPSPCEYKIESSKECRSSALENFNNLFLFNNAYYKICPDNTIQKSSNECKCAYKYILVSDTNNCLSSTGKCSTHSYQFYDYSTGKCIANCETSNYVKIEGDEKRCHSSCVGDEFYYQNLETDTVTCKDYCDKYIYFDSTNKKNCLGYCPSGYKIKNNYLVPLSQCQFYDVDINHCLNSCDESNDKHYHNFDSNQCISNCDTAANGYNYLKDNICYKGNNCNYIQTISSTDKRCLSTCNAGEGFIVQGSETPKQCYISCPSSTDNYYPYYNHGDNICMGSCTSNGNNKIYHKEGGFECFSSCKDIDDGTLIYAKKNAGNDDYICSTNIPSDCNIYIKIHNGIKKCLDNCPGNYKYLREKECLEECDDYKAIDTSSTSELPKCFEELNNCFNDYKFYNINEKKCWNSLPFGYCKKPNNDDSDDKFEVIPISDNFYYGDDDDKFCVNSCQVKGLYIDFTDKKKCIQACSKGEESDKKYYYYDPRNNECLETCIGSGLEFAYPATNTEAKPCLISNDNKCYYENDKLLIDSCDLYKAPGSKICVLSCQSNEKVNNHVCTNGCPSATPYINENNECKALGGCNFISEVGNKCISSCGIGEGFYIDGDINKICYKSCPVGTQYYVLNTNKCITNCGVSTSDNKYHINGETVCYSSCNSIPEGPNGKYLYETEVVGSNYYTCSDIIPPTCNKYFNDGDIKKCKTDCSGYAFIKGKECLNDLCDGYKANYQETTPTTPQICLTDLDECFSNNYIYYNIDSRKCWTEDKIPSSYFIKQINIRKYELVSSCSDLLEYTETHEGGKKYCYSIEQCKSLGKYKSGNQCVDTCGSNFIYNSECLSSCGIGQGHDYHNYNSLICISGCSGDHPYHKINDYICYSSCYDIDNSSIFKYLKGFICSDSSCQYYFAIESNVHKCYENPDECIKAGYSYLNGKECLATCSNFKVEPVRDSNGIITNLGKCFQDTDKCRENGYFFYNQALKKCWYDTCKNGLKIIQSGADGHPEEITIEGGGKETCVQECTTGYEESESGKFCLKTSNCPDFYDDDLTKCVSDCEDKYLMSGTKTCKSQCNSYYFINSSGKKECLAEGKNCKDIHKYYFPGTPSKCIDECYITLDSGLKKYLFYDPTNNKCVESCLNVGGKNFADEPVTTHQECKNSCGTKYYYENEKICRDTPCILFKDNSDENKICVTECGTGQKVLDNKCVAANSCSYFFVEQKIEIKGEKRTIKKCINDCQEYSTEYKFIFKSSNGKECLKSCNEDFIKIGNFCYQNNCDKSNNKIYFNPSDLSCDESCTSNFYEKLSDYSDIYICKSSCDFGQFEYEKGSSKTECLSECPEEANYIVDGNKCTSTSCNNKLIKADKGSYLIYECLNNNLCSEGRFYSETNKECYSICKGNDEGNPFSLTTKNADGTIAERKCSIKCIGDYIYYKEDKICLENCDTGLLVEERTNKCVESCNDINKFLYDNKCWDNCPVIGADPDNPQYLRYELPNKECLTHCPEEKKCHPSEGVFECISDCKEGEYKEEITFEVAGDSFTEYNCVSNYGTKYYYKTDRILRDECVGGHYVVEDTHECVENCNLANTNDKIYLYYEYDTPGDNDYTENTCILRCKEKKPFNEDGHCKRNCGTNLYYKESDKICLPSCPPNYYKNGNICVNSCKDVNKFLTTDGTCVDSCPTGENENKFYIEADHECIQDCTVENPFYTVEDQGSGIIKYKCHRDCNNYYIVNPNVIAKECLTSDQTCGELYSNQDNEKECFTICPSDKYFDDDNENNDEDKHKKCSSKCLEDRYHEDGFQWNVNTQNIAPQNLQILILTNVLHNVIQIITVK